CGRSGPVAGDHLLLSGLHDFFRNHAGCRYSQPGGLDSSRAARRLPDVVPAVRLRLSRREHSAASAIRLELCAHALLPRGAPRRISGRRSLARGVARPDRTGAARLVFLLARLDGHERHAGEGMTLPAMVSNLRLWSLLVKEFHQIRRNRRLVIMLIIPPT